MEAIRNWALILLAVYGILWLIALKDKPSKAP
jgi:hypothetical protein